MDPLGLLRDSALVPAAVALVPLAVGLVLGRLGTWAATLSVTGALQVGQALTSGLPRLPPNDALSWLYWLVAVAGVWALLSPRLPAAARAAGHLLLAVVGLRLLLDAPIEHRWSLGQAALWVGGLGVGGALLTLALDLAGRSAPPRRVAVAWGAVAAASALSLGLTGSARLGMVCGALASGLGSLAAVALARPGSWIAGAAPVLAVAIGGLLLIGAFFSALPALSGVLLALALAAPALETRRAWLGVVVAAILGAAGLGIAVLDSGLLQGEVPL